MAFRPRRKSTRRNKFRVCKRCGGRVRRNMARCKKCGEQNLR